MNPVKAFRRWRHERAYARYVRDLNQAYMLVAVDRAQRIAKAQDWWIRGEASRGIADIEQHLNRRKK